MSPGVIRKHGIKYVCSSGNRYICYEVVEPIYTSKGTIYVVNDYLINSNYIY